MTKYLFIFLIICANLNAQFNSYSESSSTIFKVINGKKVSITTTQINENGKKSKKCVINNYIDIDCETLDNCIKKNECNDLIKILEQEEKNLKNHNIKNKNDSTSCFGLVEIAKNAIKHAKVNGYNVVIVDTAGRLAVDEQMMTEIAEVKKAINPNEILFVVDSMTGQDAVNTAKAFNDRLNFDGVVLTKLDGDTRGGAALTIRSVVDKPIKFIGTSEKMDGLDVFYPDRMASRILGMGDVISLVERAQQQFDEEEARKMQKKIAKNTFGFDDFLKQIQQIKKMGNMKDLMGMIPGMGKMMKDVDIDDDAFKGIESIIHSMTPHERQNPMVLNGSRKKRIACGSGTSVQEVNQLIKQFSQMGKMMKMMQGGGAKQMMQMMKGGSGMPGMR